ncbi:YcjF family protein [uncultured Prochlorococcus sp.]|uniref:YcjF family protein n=1 Tax=uncultured Prochlorococcus sp. TaxID=159733 RepID=UPI00258E4B0E|nr:YcjF family protein [uncultured Prochlorococcus sp.]
MFDIRKENLLKDFIKFPKKNLFIILFLLGFGEWFVSDLINFAGGSIGFFALCLGGYFYLKNDKPKFYEPNNLDGWINLCNEDLNFFEELESTNELEKQNSKRQKILESILKRCNKEKISCIGQKDYQSCQSVLKSHFKADKFDFDLYEKLPKYNSSEIIPKDALNSDAILYFLELPLSANDFLWLEKFPKNMPIWLVALTSNEIKAKNQIEDLKSQISSDFTNKIITFDLNKKETINIPFSLRRFFISSSKNIENTKKRLLRELHVTWQSEIEGIRRMQLKGIQRKSQILVATTVFFSPIPSIDVMAMTVLNSLMIKEIKSVWGCNWSPEILDKVSKEILKTAIAQGVIEWSGQTLIGITKLHGPNWIVSGTFQAVSAAYLTRVVSCSLADFMAITKGVEEPDLDFIKKNSEKIVEKAFEKEKINWKGFISDFRKPLIKVSFG